MEKELFKKILFKVAFCTMACDGHIDKREVEELKIMDTSTTYFGDIDLSGELKQLLKDLDKKGTKIIEELFNSLRETKLNPIQELLILEVALRIINADEKHDDNEIKFINYLRSKLDVHDEIINDRFGKIDILHTNEYSRSIDAKIADFDLDSVVKTPDLSDLMDIELNEE